mgnify:CR=1 FL=1
MASTDCLTGISKTTVRTLRADHRNILALFQLYLAISPDSRRATVEQILGLLEEHFRKEEALLANHLTQRGKGRQPRIEEILREHDEVRAMIDELRGSESDDDQAMDEFFEDMMQTVRLHFVREERDLFPLP